MTQQAHARDTTLNQAFTDIDALMDHAKPLVELARRFAAEQDKCSDENAKLAFNDLLMNMGIISPVTKYVSDRVRVADCDDDAALLMHGGS